MDTLVINFSGEHCPIRDALLRVRDQWEDFVEFVKL